MAIAGAAAPRNCSTIDCVSWRRLSRSYSGPKFGKPVKQGGKHGCGTPSPPQNRKGKWSLASSRCGGRTELGAGELASPAWRSRQFHVGKVAGDHSTVKIDLTGGDLHSRSACC